MKGSYIAVIFALSVGSVLCGCSESDGPLQVNTTVTPPTGRDAIAVSYDGSTAVVGLIAGRTIDVGTVECSLEGHDLQVKYLTHGGWLLKETQLAVAKKLSGIPTNRAGLPVIGHFPFKNFVIPPDSACTWTVDLDAWGLYQADSLLIAAHAEVGLMSPTGEWIQEEGAWGIGQEFSGLLPYDAGRNEEGKIGNGGGHGNWASYLTVNLWKLKGLLLWNKLGSAAEVLHSRVGPNGVIVGDIEYLPAKHGSGFKPLPRTGDPNIPDNFIDFQDLNLGPRGCIEFWYHPSWSDWSVGHCVDIMWYAIIIGSAPNAFMSLEYNDWQGYLLVGAGVYGQGGVEKDYVPAAILGWSTVQPFHVALVWDGEQLAPIDRVRFFVNGSEPIPSRHFLMNPDFWGWPPEAVLRVGSRVFSGDWYRHPWEGSEGTIDNIKIWSYPKTDFSDRFVE